MGAGLLHPGIDDGMNASFQGGQDIRIAIRGTGFIQYYDPHIRSFWCMASTAALQVWSSESPQ